MSDSDTPPTQSRPDKVPWPRRLAGAALSLFLGWGTVTIFFSLEPFNTVNITDFIERFASMLARSRAMAEVSAALASPGALFFLVAYLTIPRRSIIWWWPMATFCGALVGATLGAAWSPFVWRGLLQELTFLGAIGGAATGLYAAITARWFCDPLPADRSDAS